MIAGAMMDGADEFRSRGKSHQRSRGASSAAAGMSGNVRAIRQSRMIAVVLKSAIDRGWCRRGRVARLSSGLLVQMRGHRDSLTANIARSPRESTRSARTDVTTHSQR